MNLMYAYAYPRPAVTVTGVALSENDKILIGKRTEKANAFPSFWCLPGGFLDARIIMKHIYEVNGDELRPALGNPFLEKWLAGRGHVRPGETCREALVRELLEETGLTVLPSELKIFEEYSDPEIDPRDHVVNNCYWLRVFEDTPVTPGDDIDELKWVDRFELDSIDFAFNHRQIIDDCFSLR